MINSICTHKILARIYSIQKSPDGWFPNLTRAYDNNGRCPRQKFIFGILQHIYLLFIIYLFIIYYLLFIIYYLFFIYLFIYYLLLIYLLFIYYLAYYIL